MRFMKTDKPKRSSKPPRLLQLLQNTSGYLVKQTHDTNNLDEFAIQYQSNSCIKPNTRLNLQHYTTVNPKPQFLTTPSKLEYSPILQSTPPYNQLQPPLKPQPSWNPIQDKQNKTKKRKTQVHNPISTHYSSTLNQPSYTQSRFSLPYHNRDTRIVKTTMAKQRS